LVAVLLLLNPIFLALHKTVDLVAVVVATLDQEELELQVLLDKVMTVALHQHLVMVAEVVLVHRVEMEILQMELLLHVQVE
jgi:hypothetical protein